MEGPSLRQLFDELDAEYARLRELLAGRDEAALAVRPPSGRWSVVENVQHLALTGLAHLARPRDQPDWRVYGLVQVEPRSAKQLRLEGGGTLQDLLGAWQPAYEALAARLLARDTPEVRHHVGSHIKHQQQHIREVGRLLRGGR